MAIFESHNDDKTKSYLFFSDITYIYQNYTLLMKKTNIIR